MGSSVSNLVLVGLAYREQWVSTSVAPQRGQRRLFPPHIDPNPGFKNIPTVLGPMARTVEDIEIATRVVFGKFANHSSAPVPYREVELGQKLKFGYYFDDGMARTTPACRRAVHETVEALEKRGHECVEFELPSRALHACLPCILGPLPYPVSRSRKSVRGVCCSRISIGGRGVLQKQRSRPNGVG